MTDVAIVVVGTGICIIAAFVVIQMQSRVTRRRWRKLYLEAKAYNDEYERRVERDGLIATMLCPPEMYKITYRLPDPPRRRFSTRGTRPYQRKHDD